MFILSRRNLKVEIMLKFSDSEEMFNMKENFADCHIN